LFVRLKPFRREPDVCKVKLPGLCSVCGLLDEPRRSFLRPVEPLVEKLFGIDRCRRVFDTVRRAGGGVEAVRRMLELWV